MQRTQDSRESGDSPAVRLEGNPKSIGQVWGGINRAAIAHDMETFFLKPARQAGISNETLRRQADAFSTIACRVAPHWLTEAEAIAATAGVDTGLYLAFAAGVYRNLFLHPECTSYAVSRDLTRDGAIFFHKNRDNVEKDQSAFVLRSSQPGVNGFIAVSDASVIACMMMVNDKGLAGSADYPGGICPEPAPAVYRGAMNPFLLRHIAERAAICGDALAIIREFVARGDYAGGDVNDTHWLFVDRTGSILEVSNNARHVVSREHSQGVYFSRLDDSPAAQSLRHADQPLDFEQFHRVSRDPSICQRSSIAGMSVEIDSCHPEWSTCAWVSLPAASVAFPLLMGQRRTPLCLLNGEVYRLGRSGEPAPHLWETIESAVHSSQDLIRGQVPACGQGGGLANSTNSADRWSLAQARMLTAVLRNEQRRCPQADM